MANTPYYTKAEVDFINQRNLSGFVVTSKNLYDKSLGFSANTIVSATTGAEFSNAEYNTTPFIPVTSEETISASIEGNTSALNMRMAAAYNDSKTFISGGESITSFNLPTGTKFIKISFYNYSTGLNISGGVPTEDFDKLQVEFAPTPTFYEPYGKIIKSAALSGSSALVYGDSITAGGEWLSFVNRFTGLDNIKNIAIGGANIQGFSTNLSYDYNTSFPNTANDDYNDRHLVPQVEHTPNTLRNKYDLISNNYLESDGRYIFRPDVVLLAIGFNDWKNSGTLNFENYSTVKDLDLAGLIARANDAGITDIKVFTYLRIALEKLLSGEVTETLDGMTYGVDCRKSKFIFSTPIQNANPFTYVDGGTAAHTKTLLQFGNYLQECLDDYGVKRIDGYRDSGICHRYEVVGGLGRYLTDGIHPNAEGYKKMGELISGQILSVYKK